MFHLINKYIMKKNIVFFLVLTMVSGWALAQRITYMKEGFLDGRPFYQTDLWDMSDESQYASVYFVGSTEAGGEAAPEGLWGYYPNAGLSTQLEGTFRLTSKPFTMQAGAKNYVSVKYAYEANKATSVNVRQFGLAVRQGNGEWKICSEVNSFPQEKNGVLIAELPSEMVGASDVQMSVYYKTPKDGTLYLLFFDDIDFFGYPDDYYSLTYAFDGMTFTTGDRLNLNLILTNAGNRMDSCEVSYTLDGGAVKSFKATFGSKGLYPSETNVRKGFTPEDWGTVDYGKHTVEFWLSKVNGVAIAEDKIEKTVKYLTKINANDPSFKTFPSRPLVEQFTSSTCGPCASVNKELNPLYASLDDTMTLVKYQMNWPGNGDPYYTAEGGARRNFYGINSVPAAQLNGKTLKLDNVNSIRSAIMGAAGKACYFGMTLDTVAIDTDQKIHITLKVEAVGGQDRALLHTVVMEKTTHNNVSSNGETEFHNVMLKMLPDAGGMLVSLKPDTVYTFSYVYDMAETHMEEFNDLRVACFLQTEKGEVLQSTIADITSYSDAPGAIVDVDYMPAYVCAEEVPAGLMLTSMGGKNVTSVEISGKVGRAGTPVVKEFAVDLAWGERTYVAFPGLQAGSEKRIDTVFFTVTKVNGEAFESKEVGRAITVLPSATAFKPLLEGFTSANVEGSVALNTLLDGIAETDDNAVVMKFPMKGDKYTRSAYTRYAEKMGIKAAPGLSINGHVVDVTDAGKLVNEAYFTGLLEQMQKNNSILSINTESDVTIGIGGATNIMAQLNFESPVDTSYRLLLMVVESETKLNVGTNGETEFKRTVQAMFPDESGNGLFIRNGEGMYVLSRSVLSSKIENYDNLSLVAVVKDAAGREVLQTAEFPILNKGVSNEGVMAYETLEVYPNPASEYVYLKGLENASLDVFDMTGVKVFGINNVNGDYTLDVQGYVPGVYVVKVRENGTESVARISVVK